MIRIITIEREYGSGGGDIAAKVAARLGWKLWDQLLTEEIARRMDCERSAVEKHEEKRDRVYSRLLKAVPNSPRGPPGNITPSAAPASRRRLGGRRLGVRSGHRPSASRPVGPVLTGNLCLPPAMLRHRISAFDVCVALSPGTAERYYNRGRATRCRGIPIWPCATTTTPSASRLRWPSPR